MTFTLVNLLLLLVVVLLEILLSADNAIALSLIVKKLPEVQRKKALFIGLIFALVFRGLVLIFASSLIHYYWLQLVGGLYLIYLGISHFIPKKERGEKAPTSFWKAVFLVEFTDLLFALDSALAAVALVTSGASNASNRLWIVYIGVACGLIFMRYAASFVIKLLERFPALERSAHLIVGLIGLKLIVSPLLTQSLEWLFWTLFLLCLFLGFIKKSKKDYH